ncbi:MAG: ArsA-related P-loop ATPase [Myxococcota bacterium]
MNALTEALSGLEVVLATGPGGVGKTTSSAALAVNAAQRGKRVLVLTIDPARRLADALGVTLDNAPRRVEMPGLESGTGELWALMLDPVRTFDELIERLAPSPAVADRLMNNIVYRQMTRTLAGTLEYTAVEKLYDLRERYDFDLIVVDTPPSKNVLDFIEAPQWLLRFLDERVFRWFLMLEGQDTSSGIGAVLLRRTGRVVRDVLGRVFGEHFVGELSEFMHAIESMTHEFRRRADAIQSLLQNPVTGFLVVATTDPFVMSDAVYLREEIERRGVQFAGFLVNRVYRPTGLVRPEDAADMVRKAVPDDPAVAALAEKLVAEAAAIDARAEADKKRIEQVRTRARWRGLIGTIPREVHEIHDLDALGRLAAAIEPA